MNKSCLVYSSARTDGATEETLSVRLKNYVLLSPDTKYKGHPR